MSCGTATTTAAVHQIRNKVVGKDPFEVELEAGSFYWGDHLANPIIHKARRARTPTAVQNRSYRWNTSPADSYGSSHADGYSESFGHLDFILDPTQGIYAREGWNATIYGTQPADIPNWIRHAAVECER